MHRGADGTVAVGIHRISKWKWESNEKFSIERQLWVLRWRHTITELHMSWLKACISLYTSLSHSPLLVRIQAYSHCFDELVLKERHTNSVGLRHDLKRLQPRSLDHLGIGEGEQGISTRNKILRKPIKRKLRCSFWYYCGPHSIHSPAACAIFFRNCIRLNTSVSTKVFINMLKDKECCMCYSQVKVKDPLGRTRRIGHTRLAPIF